MNQLVAVGLLGERQRRVARADRILSRLTGRIPRVSLEERRGVRVRGGDMLLLASGEYGDVDLSGLANSGFVTIAAAPGARPHFTSLDLSRASHFVLRGITVTAGRAPPERRQLVSVYAPGEARADNIVLDDLDIGSTLAIAATPQNAFVARAPDGIVLAGDCLTLTGAEVHDAMTAVEIYRARQVLIADNTFRDFAIDGIQYSGRSIVICDNIVIDQWPTSSLLHPDCMQGTGSDEAAFGPVLITGNVCIRSIGLRAARPGGHVYDGGWQGIVIFDGHWSGVMVRCNLVLPAAGHGIALYGVDDALIEGNVVLGLNGGPASWIAALPAKNGRQSTNVVIRKNQAMAFLNAVKSAQAPFETMIDALGVNREDSEILAMLRGELSGVSVAEGNVWQTAQVARPPLGFDERFEWTTGVQSKIPRDVPEARQIHPLPEACKVKTDAG
ncbi:right-handed parallel beta-helix repeat-containing protein [Erythrobacter sp. NE805]|uniref:right-handed parallel beta-helix repeat-containing protein n=1 Tax=Erythrobacter sp. NE805 TaxID=3389875 RepID=UPI00396B1B9E